MVALFAVVFCVAVAGAIVFAREKYPKGAIVSIAVAVFALIIDLGVSSPPPRTTSDEYRVTNAVVDQSTPEPTDTPYAPPSDPSVRKRIELGEVNHSVTAAKIRGNPQKYIGDTVKLRCKIENVVSPDTANATCGAEDQGMPSTSGVDFTDAGSVQRYNAKVEKAMNGVDEQAFLVITGEKVGNLDANQSVTVLGTVVEPMEGKNGMGADTSFPTVHADFIE